MEDIIKVQSDTFSNGLLIYNEDKSIMFEKFDDELLKLLKWRWKKKYFKYEVINKILEIWDEVQNIKW